MEVFDILREKDSNCDAGRALRRVLELLADANLQEAEEGETEEEYVRKSEAETALIQLATAVTGGKRWMRGREVE